METETTAKWKSKEHIVWRTKDDLLVVLDTVTGHYYTLNETAVDLWRGLLEEKKSFDEVITLIQSRYTDTPGESDLVADCQESIAFWASEGLIEKAAG